MAKKDAFRKSTKSFLGSIVNSDPHFIQKMNKKLFGKK